MWLHEQLVNFLMAAKVVKDGFVAKNALLQIGRTGFVKARMDQNFAIGFA
ncbi:hypothetical protein ED21_21499 [Erythrobacter sp. SD-21]|nr:hypothetical protein ED21_21499 [Erythrobacter sp. SD-21]